MKKFLFISFISVLTSAAMAQTNAATQTTSSAAKTPDTVNKALSKHPKIRVVNGTEFSSNRDIIDNITKSKDHTTLNTAITNAGLSETLKSRGPYTFFAPTNTAFSKLTPGILDTLSKPAHVTDLTRLITYHVINGRVTSKSMAKDIADGKGEATYMTLTGAKLKVKINGDRNIVLVDEKGNEAIISSFDIEQSNGIVDVVTNVLVPNNR